jgi:hypothetical protein
MDLKETVTPTYMDAIPITHRRALMNIRVPQMVENYFITLKLAEGLLFFFLGMG